MPAEELKQYLNDNHVKFVTITHSLAYTAQDIAAAAHISGKDLAKTVMVKIDDRMTMVVLQGHAQVDLQRLAEVVGAENVELASEGEFAEFFANCEVGAMPPFGNLYGIPVYVSAGLAADEEIAFNAGSHTELIKLAYADFARLVSPKVLEL